MDARATQLFWHGKELKSDLYDKLTLNNLKLHTGFSLNGYDLVRFVACCGTDRLIDATQINCDDKNVYVCICASWVLAENLRHASMHSYSYDCAVVHIR